MSHGGIADISSFKIKHAELEIVNILYTHQANQRDEPKGIHPPHLPDTVLRIFGIKKEKRASKQDINHFHRSIHPLTLPRLVSIHIPLHPPALFSRSFPPNHRRVCPASLT